MTLDEIKIWRLEMKMSQEDFAHYVGVTTSTVNRWEQLRRIPSKMALTLMIQKKKEYDDKR